MSLSAHIETHWKGKGKATDQDFEDLNPTITYRHLYAQNLGIRDPLRVIALCDSDAFYAACEMVRLGTDKNTPLVVLQWDAMIAINYPARKFGISRMKKYNLKELQEKHPELIIVHVATYKEGQSEPGYWDDVDTMTHKVSLDYYRRESLKIAAMFKECLPGCEIEKASIDEAFFDFTKLVREIILERYPYLAQVPSDAPNGVDTPLPPPPPILWDDVGYVIPVNPAPPEEEQAEGASANQEVSLPAEVQEEDPPTTWHDVALSIGAEIIGKARKHVLEELGYSTSAGIARNKFLAKLTASYKKPNSQSILRNAAIPRYLRPLPFQKIRFLGGKLGTAIGKEFEASTVGDLLSISLEEMQRKFGEDSIWIYEVLRGIDRSEVKEKKSTLNKSMLASKNLPKPITNASDGFHWIRVLAAELALRLNEARETSPNLWPKSIVLHARKGYEPGRSKQAPFPYMREITVDTIAAAGSKLWKELVGKELAMNVTNVQLAFTGVEGAEVGQRSIEGFLKSGQPAKRQRGEDGDVEDVRRISIDGSLPDERNDISTTTINMVPPANQSPDAHGHSFVCSRCGKTITIPSPTTSSIDGEEQLAALRLEHDDFHFARDLAKESAGGLVISGPSKGTTISAKPISGASRGSPKKKRRKEQPGSGIEKFFGRKT
ncbi:DNA polymerase eta [Lyophyllum atratum]|nr:DNA polymerase eta [Lyophyllum atratum]